MSILSNLRHIIKGENIDSLYHTIDSLNNKIKELEDRLKMVLSGNVAKESEIAFLQSQNNDFLEKQKSNIKEIALLKVKVGIRDNKIKKLQEENTELSKSISDAIAEKDKIVEEKDNLQNLIITKEQEFSQYREEVDKLRNELSRLNEKLNTVCVEEKSANKNVEELTESLRQKDSIINDLKKQLASASPKDDTSIQKISIHNCEHTVEEQKTDPCIVNISDDTVSDTDDMKYPIVEKITSETVGDKILQEQDGIKSDDDDIFEDRTLPTIYKSDLILAGKLSIPEVFDVKENRIINSKDFFSQNESELILWRRNLQVEYSIGRARFVCPKCRQPVKISGYKYKRGKVCFFAHFKDSDDCPYKTGTNRTKEEIEAEKFALVQESERHKKLKGAIALALKGAKSYEKGVKNVECEKHIKCGIPYINIRRPDVYAEYNGRKYVFEIQLSTTFVSIIVGRDIFYRLNNYNIIWIFNFEDNQEYVNLQNLMCKDIYYANKRNIFIFDADAENKSKEKGELVLKCQWLDENGLWSHEEYVTLDMLKCDEENNKPYYFDADKKYLEKYPQCIELRKNLEYSREELLKGLMERQKKEEEERNKLQLELSENESCVKRFQKGKKYGYKYKESVIIQAVYTSAEDIREDGYAQVGFNRKIGLVRKDGKEIVPVEYKTIDVINAQYGIIMALYKQIDLFVGNEKYNLCDKFDDKEQKIIKEYKYGEIEYLLLSPQYKYTYTDGYYGSIRHKERDGYSKNLIFSVLEGQDLCVVNILGKVYYLSNDKANVVSENYADVKYVGVNQLFIAKNPSTNLYGIINLQNDTILPFKYARLIPTASEYLIFRNVENPCYGVINYLGQEFISPTFDSLIYINTEHYAYCQNHLWGICNQCGIMLQAPSFTYLKVSPNGEVRVSCNKDYISKWIIDDGTPSYNDDDVKSYLLNENGDIVYTEQVCGQYRIRHSGDLYSILSFDNKDIVGYSLTEVNFMPNKENAVIKNTEGKTGLFYNEKCVYFEKCVSIQPLYDDTFVFIDVDGNQALNSHLGPINGFPYCNIKDIDGCHFMASLRVWNRNSPSGNYVVIDRYGKEMSEHFSEIGEFENGFANATYQGRNGTINAAGEMQSKIVMKYGNDTLYERFENYFFSNQLTGFVSDEYQHVEKLSDKLFIVKKRGELKVRLFSLDTNETTKESFYSITRLIGDLFVMKVQEASLYNSTAYQLYKNTSLISPDRYLQVSLLDNGYIALQKFNGTTWKLMKIDGTFLGSMEFDSIVEADENSFTVKVGGHVGRIDLNGNVVVDKKVLDKNIVLTHCFGYYGIEDSEGNEILSLKEHFSKVELLEGQVMVACKNNLYALYSTTGKQITEYKFSSVIYDSTNRYAVIQDKRNGFIDLQGNYMESSALPINTEEKFIFVIMERYGLRNANKEIIIPAEYVNIKYLGQRLLAVKNGDKRVALFNIDGKQLTEFIYSAICCKKGTIQATRNKGIGGLDNNGNEIVYKEHFDGGYIQSMYGDNSVISDAGEIIIPTGYSKIESLGNVGVFALWNGDKVAVGNISKIKTEAVYKSVRYIGNGFYIVSRHISKKIRTRNNEYGYRRNTYSCKTVEENKYGIMDNSLHEVIRCKYSNISNFDNEQKLTAINANKEKITISLHELEQKSQGLLVLSIGKEYTVTVQAFMAIGLIAKIQGRTFVIHKKYLFKEKKEFNKGDVFIAKYLGNDANGYPLWETMDMPK